MYEEVLLRALANGGIGGEECARLLGCPAAGQDRAELVEVQARVPVAGQRVLQSVRAHGAGQVPVEREPPAGFPGDAQPLGGVGDGAEALVRAGLRDLHHQAPAAVAPVVLDVEIRLPLARVEQGDRVPLVAGREARSVHRGPLRLDRRDHGAHHRPGPREHPLVDALEEILPRLRRDGEDEVGVLVDVPLVREVVHLHGVREPKARREPARLRQRVLLAERERPRDPPQDRLAHRGGV